jgi:hypothetical protein
MHLTWSIGGYDNVSNRDNRDDTNDMDIEKTMNVEQQGNANNQKGTVKRSIMLRMLLATKFNIKLRLQYCLALLIRFC